MIRASMLGLLALSLVALGSLTAQQPDKDDPPPVLLKKKANPDDKKPAAKPDDKKLDEKKTDEKKSDDKKPATKPGEKGEPKDEPEGGDPEAKAKELLARIAKDIDSAKERLDAKDPGDATQQVQRDIVKGLDDLIEAMKNPPPQQNQDQQSNPGAGEQSKGKDGQQSRSSRQRTARNQRGQQPGGNPMAKNGQGEPQGGQPKPQPGQGGNKPGAGGTSPPSLDKLADLYKDTWGDYPFRERQEMDAYQKEGYMAKYRELLKQYYSTIAEKGRRPAEGDR